MWPCLQNLPHCKQLWPSNLIIGVNFSCRSLGWAHGSLFSIYFIINAYVEHMQLMWDLKRQNSPVLTCTCPYPWYPGIPLTKPSGTFSPLVLGCGWALSISPPVGSPQLTYWPLTIFSPFESNFPHATGLRIDSETSRSPKAWNEYIFANTNIRVRAITYSYLYSFLSANICE
jgi:hypothetical protein